MIASLSSVLYCLRWVPILLRQHVSVLRSVKHPCLPLQLELKLFSLNPKQALVVSHAVRYQVR